MRAKTAKYIEITEDINVIPAGIYRVFNQQEEAIEFMVGNKIIFGISSDAQIYFRTVPIIKAIKLLTPPEQFVSRYNNLKNKKRKAVKDKNKPFTYCMMHPSIIKEVQSAVL